MEFFMGRRIWWFPLPLLDNLHNMMSINIMIVIIIVCDNERINTCLYLMRYEKWTFIKKCCGYEILLFRDFSWSWISLFVSKFEMADLLWQTKPVMKSISNFNDGYNWLITLLIMTLRRNLEFKMAGTT